MSLRNWLTFVVFAGLACSANAAWAHVETGRAAGFATGFLHPMTGLDHVIAMVAVGIWGSQLGRPAVWLLPVAFPMMMAVGAALAVLKIHLPSVEIGIALSGIGLGAMVLFEARPPLPVAVALVGGFALFHGHAHGSEMPPGSSPLHFSIGFVIGTGLLHAFGIAIGLIHKWPKGRLALRVAGAGIAVGGGLFLLEAIK